MPAPRYQPFFRSAAEWTPYTQAEPDGAAFRLVLKKDEVPDLSLGEVTLTGPIHKTPASHPDNEQVYLILEGRGTVHLGDQNHALNGPGVVVIPRNTPHSVEVAAGQSLRYMYINQYSAGH